MLRRDAHGVHLVGDADRPVATLAFNAAWSGSLCVLEGAAPDVAGALAALRSWNLELQGFAGALLGVVLADPAAPRLWPMTGTRSAAISRG